MDENRADQAYAALETALRDAFRAGLTEAFIFAAFVCLIAAAASWSRGNRYVHDEH